MQPASRNNYWGVFVARFAYLKDHDNRHPGFCETLGPGANVWVPTIGKTTKGLIMTFLQNLLDMQTQSLQYCFLKLKTNIWVDTLRREISNGGNLKKVHHRLQGLLHRLSLFLEHCFIAHLQLEVITFIGRSPYGPGQTHSVWSCTIKRYALQVLLRQTRAGFPSAACNSKE